MSEASPGRMLRSAREKQGLHIAALAAAIKVAPRKLDALENDRWEDLPDATFTRALAQTVCRTLKIDPRPVLDLLPASATTLERANNGLNAPFRRGRDEPGTPTAAIRPMVWAGLVLMAAAVAVVLLPEGFLQRRGAAPAASTAASASDAAAAASAPEPAVETVAGVPAPAQTPAVAASAALAVPAGAASQGLPAAPAPQPTPTPAALPPAALPTAVPPPPPGATAPAALPAPRAASEAGAAQVVQLRATQASWVEVRDARGAVLLSRLLQPGESVGFDRGLPLRLTIGNAQATQLTLRGQPVDLAGRSRDNVARLELQ